jgi:hypothetical protein
MKTRFYKRSNYAFSSQVVQIKKFTSLLATGNNHDDFGFAKAVLQKLKVNFQDCNIEGMTFPHFQPICISRLFVWFAYTQLARVFYC